MSTTPQEQEAKKLKKAQVLVDLDVVETSFEKWAKPGHFSYSDRIIILENAADTSFVSWNITPGHDNIANQHLPSIGDTLSLHTTKPFSSADIYEFISKGASFDSERL